MKITVLTLGCKVNQSESSVIEGNLLKNGNTLVKLSEHPDICIINTCTVTAKSDYQSRQLIRRALRESGQVYVTGCYAEMNRQEIQNIDGRILIFDNNNKYRIINMISPKLESIAFNYSKRARPSVKIQDGCNMACSYCIVPRARGKSQSVRSYEIIERIKSLEDEGYNEVVLTGIHIGSYGYDLNPQLKLLDMLKMILKKTKIQRIRISSLETYEINEELLDIFREERICRHIHLPLQSGDDNILKLMNRKYTITKYRKVVEQIMDNNPGIALGTDIIAGFPGEGENEFENTRKFLEDLPFSYLHVFPYSYRPNTIASQMKGQVASSVKKERCAVLDRLNRAIKKRYAESQIGRTLAIVIEERGNDGTASGTSSNYLKVRVSSNSYPVKSLAHIGIRGREGNALIGNPMQNQ